jgi:serine/threonine-protein kinase
VSEKFGKYQLVRKLAVGGMAEIFLATHAGPEGFKKHVAIKRILPHLTEDQDFVTMFLDEARLVARFNHPSIVQIFELGKVGYNYFLSMEYINGVSMSKVIKERSKKKTPFPFEYGAKVLSFACEGLEYCHNFADPDGTPLNLIHRDVSPQNIMLTYDGVVKVLDFGIAKAVGNLYQTRTSSLKGKAAYMSPEQITQKTGLDRRSDIFSLGICLYEFATGKRPFDGDTELELMLSIVQTAARDPRELDPNIPQDLVDVINKALEKNRNNRYQTARELRADIEQFLHSRQVLVDSYTLGSFLREVIPPGEHLTGYSTPTPSRPGLEIIEPQIDTIPPRSQTQDTDKTPISITDRHRPAIPQGEEFPTVLTPSEVIRPLVDEPPKQEVLPFDGITEEQEIRKRKGKQPLLMGVGLVLVMIIGAAAAFLAFGDDGSGSDTEADAGISYAGITPTPAEPKPAPRDAGVKEAPDAGTATQVAAADPGRPKPAKVVEARPIRKKKKRRRKRRRVAMASTTPDPPKKEEPPKKPETKPKVIKQPKKEPPKVAKANLGSLTIYSKPWTEVYIDGTSYGSTPTDGPIGLKPGIHIVELRNPRQGIKHRQHVRILPGKKQTIRKSFRRGFLKVYVKPFGEVFVNGVSKGLTPLDKPIELYEGIHTLRVSSARTGKEKTKKVRIDPGKTTTVKLDLR